MKEYTIICWRTYGEWRATKPFESRAEAEEHNRRYLSVPEKDYVKDVTFIPVQLPE